VLILSKLKTLIFFIVTKGLLTKNLSRQIKSDSKINYIYEGTSEIQRIVISRGLAL